MTAETAVTAALPPIVEVDPLLSEADAQAMVDLARRFGTYHPYASHERLEHPLGEGLYQRHDSVVNFVRTGGYDRRTGSAEALTARTSYLREEYAYDGKPLIAGIEPFLHAPSLIEAAREVHGRPVVEPAIAYANLLLPGQELAVHTDVPEFRGANRKHLPQWLLVVMHHSGLFDPWRLHIATGVSYFQDAGTGALVAWPDGPDGPSEEHPVRANTAVVLDTDTIFHGVAPVCAIDEPPVAAVGTALDAPPTPDGDWVLHDAGGTELGRYAWDDLRFSVSWKAYCFADEAGRDAWRDHTDDLDESTIVDRLVDDLRDQGVVTDEPRRDRDLGLLLIDTYIRFPA